MNAWSDFIAFEFANSLPNWAATMPNLNVYLLEGHSDAQKELLLARMTDAVVDSIAAPQASVRIFLIELPRAHVSVGGVSLAAAARAGEPIPAGGPTVHVFLIAGRSEAAKEVLIGRLTGVIGEVLDIPPAPVRIMIFDVANTDFGMEGKTARAMGR